MLLNYMCLVIILSVVYASSDFSKLHNIDFKVKQFLKHNTHVFYKDPYGLTDIIIRRGEVFEFDLKLGKNYKNQKILVTFKFTSKKDIYNVTLPSENQKNWVFHQHPGQRHITGSVYIHQDAPVGAWEMFVVLMDEHGNIIKKVDVPNRIIILFNPWSYADKVYLPSTEHLDEYVMNEKGIIFSYNWKDYKKRPWLFNQFQPGILSAVLYVMERAELNSVQRGDPVRVVRDLSWMLNVDANNEGVLKGKWTEPYDDVYDGRMSTRPTDWISSASILHQYVQTKGRPVAYGQCWVFAGLFTTILRTLGIPARPVSAFAAAHDFGGDLTADVRYDKFGFLNQTNSDRIWNFHVWTQAWMSRKHDLGEEYSGWQDADATPQGLHAGRMQVGPASQRAVKEAEVRKKYETAFVYMEQNADEVHWENGRIKTIKRDSIGLATVTKAVDSETYEDITSYYKEEENTPAERASYRKACSTLNIQCPSLQPNLAARSRGKSVTVSIDMKMIWKIGSSVQINLILKNPSMDDQRVDVTLRVTSTYYDGADGSVIKNRPLKNVLVAGRRKRTLKFDLVPDEYIDKLKDFYTNRVEAVVTHKNGRIENDLARLVFIAPPLRIDCPPEVMVGQEFSCVLDFQNPLDRPLDDCYFMVEGQRIKKKVVQVGNVEPGNEASAKINLTSNYTWHETIVGTFVSRTVKDIRGSVEVHIMDNVQRHFSI